MKGVVDESGRALLEIEVLSDENAVPSPLTVWIDTGFTGDLVVPQSEVDRLGLSLSGTVTAVLADGSQTLLRTFSCYVRWFGVLQRLEVVANEGDYPLLGVGMLLERELTIDYRSGSIALA